MIQTPIYRNDAISLCRSYGGFIPSILNKKEQEFLDKMAKKEPFWIALDYETDGWIWLDNQPLKYLNWAPSHPKADKLSAYSDVANGGWKIEETEVHTYELVNRSCEENIVELNLQPPFSLEKYLVKVDDGAKYYCLINVHLSLIRPQTLHLSGCILSSIRSGFSFVRSPKPTYSGSFAIQNIALINCWRKFSAHMLEIENADEANFIFNLLYNSHSDKKKEYFPPIPLALLPQDKIIQIGEINAAKKLASNVNYFEHYDAFITHPLQAYARLCREGWTQVGRTCIRFFNSTVTHQEAENFCTAMFETHLVFVTSPSDERFLQYEVNKLTNDGFWIGVKWDSKKLKSSDQKVFLPRYDLPFSAEFLLSPDRNKDKRSPKKCFTDKFARGWKSTNCMEKHPFVCQYRLSVTNVQNSLLNNRFVCKQNILPFVPQEPPDSMKKLKKENAFRESHFRNQHCDIGTIEIPGRACIEINLTPKTFDEASEYCESYGASLAMFHKLSEVYELKPWLPKNSEFWAGVRRYDSSWLWVISLVPVYLPWENYEPQLHSPIHKCAVLKSNGHWRSEINQQVTVFVAEQMCRYFGTSLVKISSGKEQSFIERYLPDEVYWIGLFYKNKTWLWNGRDRVFFKKFTSPVNNTSANDNNNIYAIGTSDGWKAVNKDFKATVLCTYDLESLMGDQTFSDEMTTTEEPTVSDLFPLLIGICFLLIFATTTLIAWCYAHTIQLDTYGIYKKVPNKKIAKRLRQLRIGKEIYERTKRKSGGSKKADYEKQQNRKSLAKRQSTIDDSKRKSTIDDSKRKSMQSNRRSVAAESRKSIPSGSPIRSPTSATGYDKVHSPPPTTNKFEDIIETFENPK
uniref:C-type lectin domain-containing protein n=1 Tax=Syphacia muris TaxID=451379 RepID=A0A0N5AED4_9BILA